MSGSCLYDPVRRVLFCPPFEVALASNEGDLLLALIDGVEGKENIIARVWGGRGLVVSDSSYYKALYVLRARLADAGLGRSALKTLPRRGAVLMCDIAIGNVAVSHVAVGEGGETVVETFVADSFEVAGDALPVRVFSDESANRKVKTIGPSRPGFHWAYKLSRIVLVMAGAILPLLFVMQSLGRPVELQAWNAIWAERGGRLYVEDGETLSKDAIVGYFPQVLTGEKWGGYFIRKPLSKLLVTCQKKESKGEAICVNYLNVSRPD